LIGYVKNSQREFFGENEESDEDVVSQKYWTTFLQLSRDEYKVEEILDECFDDLDQIGEFSKTNFANSSRVTMTSYKHS